jgi:hypothetical protein
MGTRAMKVGPADFFSQWRHADERQVGGITPIVFFTKRETDRKLTQFGTVAYAAYLYI